MRIRLTLILLAFIALGCETTPEQDQLYRDAGRITWVGGGHGGYLMGPAGGPMRYYAPSSGALRYHLVREGLVRP